MIQLPVTVNIVVTVTVVLFLWYAILVIIIIDMTDAITCDDILQLHNGVFNLFPGVFLKH